MRVRYVYALVFVLIASIGFFGLQDAGVVNLSSAYSYLAGIFFAEKITPDAIRSEYANSSLKVLIVPGHEKDTGGTEYKNLKERELVLQLGKYLQEELNKDTHLTSQITRDGSGDFTQWFKDYIAEGSIDVKVFTTSAKVKTAQAIIQGLFTPTTGVEHNTAPGPTALVLYGINKYANEHAVDLVLHLHLNDYPRRYTNQPGKYTGFAIYIPESQLPNTRSSKAIGDSIARELAHIEPRSSYKKEQPALVEDQELIAIGSYGTRDGASLLIEYGYIYEKKFTDLKLRDKTLRDLAHATYLGIEDYFNQKVALSTTR
ncbi:MAG: N-acetylmuramoyl-L-alanine amidase [Candidatus Paceibacterota bacterium]|jgi:N-acetylmuramoyl-L-alanine amidase